MDQSNEHELNISNIGIGCYGLSGAYGPKDRGEFAKVVRRAYELGVTFFDTADAYGDAEAFLGDIVRDFRDKICIATKVGVVRGVRPDLSPERIKQACECSLRKLSTDYIDLYQVHFDDSKTPVEDVVEALEGLTSEGKIRRWGLCHLDDDRIRDYCKNGNPYSVLMEFSAVARRTRNTLLPLCREKGMAAIAFSVTGRGLLTGAIREGHAFAPDDIRTYDPLFQREQFESGLRVAGKLADLAAKRGSTPVQAGIAWVLSQPGIVCALTGPSTVRHLEENMGAVEFVLTDGELRELEALFAEEDAWVDAERKRNLAAILDHPSPPGASVGQVFADLVYVLETGIQSGMLKDSDVVPLFEELVALRSSNEHAAIGKMDGVRKRIARMLDQWLETDIRS